jgi:DUF4097 and DUF4098 domain-containing protein YvlB
MLMPRLALITVTTLSVLLAGLMPAVAAPQQETETVDRTVPLPADGTLRLRTFSGAVRITAASGRDVVIHAVRRAERPQLDDIRLVIETSGSTVSIDSNRRESGRSDEGNNVVDTTFEIQVPADARLDIEGFSSEVVVDGVTAEQRLKTFSGPILVTGARGRLDVETFSGRAEIDVAGVEAVPDVDVQTFSGGVIARVAPGARGEVDFDTFSGRLDSDLPLTVRSSGRRDVSGELPGGGGEGRLRFRSFSADVNLMAGR